MAEIPPTWPRPASAPRRPPVGALVCAAYLSLWAMILALLSIFTVMAAISAPNPLTLESLVIAFCGVPVFHALAVLMLTAAFGIVRARHWTLRLVSIATYAGAIFLLGITTIGTHNVVQIAFNGANILGLLAVGHYLERPEVRAYFANETSAIF